MLRPFIVKVSVLANRISYPRLLSPNTLPKIRRIFDTSKCYYKSYEYLGHYISEDLSDEYLYVRRVYITYHGGIHM